MGLAKIIETLGILKRVARHYDCSYLSAIVRFLKLYCLERYTRAEIFPSGIANPRTSADQMAHLASRHRAHRLQCAINPMYYAYVTEDKAIFHHFCIGANIRTPQLYGVLDPSLIWTPEGRQLGRLDDWAGFFREDLPSTFVVKPSSGIHGESIYVLTREDDRFIELSGATYSGEELLETLASDPSYDRFIIQERVENHQSLAALSGTEALQTTRIITGIDDSGEPSILIAVQKLIAGSNSADNFGWGREGNLIAQLDTEQGTIVRAVTGHENGLELKTVDTHPTSGRQLEGFQIPNWQELCQLVVVGSRKLMPIRTIGWDIAVTPDGPVVIEANIYWSPDHTNAVHQTKKFLDFYSRVTRKTRLGRSF